MSAASRTRALGWWLAVPAALSVLLAACTDPAAIQAGPPESVPSALDDPAAPGLPVPIVAASDLERVLPPDGIPAIDEPRFVEPQEVTFLREEEPVVALEVAGDARAYPVQILVWHEIVNDVVGGRPVAVSYCPLCNSAVTYDRELDERILSFGTSGRLYRSALVMYDRQTESLWSHFTAEAVAGHLTGARLEVLPTALVSWETWRAAHPGGRVLSRETGFDRDYGVNPYPGYDDVTSSPFRFSGDPDGRLAAMTRVVGVGEGETAVAIRYPALERDPVRELEVDGRRVVVWWAPGTSSGIDRAAVGAGRDVGATGVFEPRAGGRSLTFRSQGDSFVDEQTGTRWNVLGQAVDGPLRGERLPQVAHLDAFWFAWAAYQPVTEVTPTPLPGEQAQPTSSDAAPVQSPPHRGGAIGPVR